MIVLICEELVVAVFFFLPPPPSPFFSAGSGWSPAIVVKFRSETISGPGLVSSSFHYLKQEGRLQLGTFREPRNFLKALGQRGGVETSRFFLVARD